MDRVVANCIGHNSPGRGPAALIHEGDARDLPVRNATVDLVLTSPPYLNAIDYMRCSKFSLVWMGHRISQLRRIRTNSVGSEAGKRSPPEEEDVCGALAQLKHCSVLAKRYGSVLARYAGDIRDAMCEASRVLVPGGLAVYVVGDNTVRGTYVRNSSMVSALAKLCGLVLEHRCVRTLPANRRYLPPPAAENGSAKLDIRMRREVVLMFRKPAQAALGRLTPRRRTRRGHAPAEQRTT